METMPKRRTTLYELTDRIVGGTLLQEIRGRRGHGDSFRDISLWLYTVHGVDVTEQTIANWLDRVDAA